METGSKRPFSTHLPLLLHILVWLPLLWLAWGYWQGQLGINPIRTMILRTGKTALILLLLSLTMTPLRLLFGWKWVYPLRRLLGLYAFMYASFHFLIFAGLDYGFDLALIGDALRTNQFTQAGLAALLILIPLALTSSRRSFARLGEKRWQALHRLSYLATALAVLHYALLVRQYYAQPILFGVILAALLGIRLAFALRRQPQAAAQ